ncbi:hypothetical protein FO519_003751 [Halicephalobus sp. NKZ332]|nr:hypothetical protein FO519_003751 [Halicephalobus sp. NKZ332]
MPRTAYVGLLNGMVFGVSFAASSELFRIYRGSTWTCKTCLAPVGMDGKWRGEREVRSFSIAWTVAPEEWAAEERLKRRQKCFGNRYYMVNNQIYDSTCYEQVRIKPRIQRSHTTIIDYQIPAPIQPDEEVHSELPSQSEHHSRFRFLQRSSSNAQKHHCNIQSGACEEPGKMSHEMKKKLANDLLSTLMSLRVREMRKKNQEEELKEKEQRD